MPRLGLIFCCEEEGFPWIPAFAGMTMESAGMTTKGDFNNGGMGS